MLIHEEAARCLLCRDAPCALACPQKKDPAAFVRSLRFENLDGASVRAFAASRAAGCGDCRECEKACIHPDRPIRIGELAIKRQGVANAGDSALTDPKPLKDIDLSVDFCGVRCENPFFLSSSVVASGYEMCAKAFESGWAGIVYKTIGFLIPEEVSPRFAAVGKEGTPFVGFRNLEQISDSPLAYNLDVLRRLKKAYPSKVIVSSIMGQSEAEWTELARLSTEAGVDIIECNFSCPHMSGDNLGSDVGVNPDIVARYTAAAKKGTRLPVLAKMTPNLGNMEIPAIAAMRAGADGIAAINTIKSITGLDLESLASIPAVSGKSSVSGYSGKAVKPIALRFIADMAKHPELKTAPLSGMGGIETWKDAAEFLLFGCTNLQVTTAVMQYGYRIVEDLIEGLKTYMAGAGYGSVRAMSGKALDRLVGADLLDRKTIAYPKINRDACVGCGRCTIACADGGHQAIDWAEGRKPVIQAKKCVGCHLCLYVCPTGAITAGKRIMKAVKGETA